MDSLALRFHREAFTDGISKKDLEYAGSFFTGLEFVFANFDKLVDGRPDAGEGEGSADDSSNEPGRGGDASNLRAASSKRVTLSHTDLEKFLRESEGQLTPQERKGLIQLTMLLRKLEGSSGRGLTDNELQEIDPKTIWNQS